MMVYEILPSKPFDRPYWSLLLLFTAWKLLLLLVVLCSPGQGYDTSTSLLQHPFTGNLQTDLLPKTLLRTISNKLSRWDAIYFTDIARHGYIYEQEWAFGWGINYPMTFGAFVLRSVVNVPKDFTMESLVGIVIAHIAHGVSVVALYELARELTFGKESRRLALVAASLHIFSPAGVFLSAPYGESSFAALSFIGYFLFIRGAKHAKYSLESDLRMITSGLILGCATMVRSNGLLNGMLFLEEVIITIMSMKRLTWSTMSHLVATMMAGAFIALGYTLPQAVAYLEYCGTTSASARSWCMNMPPSIFSFVQSHYWNVGFLRYWTISNLPLFLLATPMLMVMSLSAYRALCCAGSITEWPNAMHVQKKRSKEEERKLRLLRSLAIPQVVLVVLTFFNFHVQIITRISSAYPVWYIWLAVHVLYPNTNREEVGGSKHAQRSYAIGLVRLLSMYAIVQSGLFASFLPPA